MPVCYITLSENSPKLNAQQMQQVRKIIAKGLDSNSRKLDETHIAMRQQYGKENVCWEI